MSKAYYRHIDNMQVKLYEESGATQPSNVLPNVTITGSAKNNGYSVVPQIQQPSINISIPN